MITFKDKVSIALAGAVLLAAPVPAQDCIHYSLEGSAAPEWIGTLEYSARPGDAGEIIVADPAKQRLVTYGFRGDNSPSVGFLSDVGIPPVSITKVEGGFLIKYREEVVLLGPDKKVGETFNLRTTKAGRPTGLGSLYSNWVTKGPTFLGFGSVVGADLASQQYDPSRGFQLGFVRGRIDFKTGEFLGVELLETTENNDLYLFGLPYFAATDRGMFYVRMVDDEATVVKVNERRAPGGRLVEDLDVVPGEFRRVPKITTPNTGSGAVKPRFAELERHKMVYGLFGDGQFLYLLTRDPGTASPKVVWRVFKVDPAKNQILGDVRLPTTTHHLSVTIGPDAWYLFERGEVKGWGDQEISGLKVVPKTWITNLQDSPLSGEVRCAERELPLARQPSPPQM